MHCIQYEKTKRQYRNAQLPFGRPLFASPKGANHTRFVQVQFRSIASIWRCQSYFSFSPDSRRSSEGSAGPKSATNGKQNRPPGSRALSVMVLPESAIASYSAEANMETCLAVRHSAPPPGIVAADARLARRLFGGMAVIWFWLYRFSVG